MSFVIEHQINLLVSSDTSNGALNKSNDGSQFEIQIEDALQIPADALNITVSVDQATVWWVIPNIITGINDLMYILVPRAIDDVLTAYIVVIPQGLYDLSGLSQVILRELSNQGAKTDPIQTITLSPDDATQKVEIKFNYIGSQIDFTQPQTPRNILGFNSQIVGPNVVAPFNYIAPNVANFNTVNYFLIHSSLVNQGIRFNNSFNSTIAQVLIDVPPGSQIVSSPFNPARTSAQELAGAKLTRLRFFLTDDRNLPVNTNGENWSARIVIRYSLAHIIH